MVDFRYKAGAGLLTAYSLVSGTFLGSSVVGLLFDAKKDAAVKARAAEIPKVVRSEIWFDINLINLTVAQNEDLQFITSSIPFSLKFTNYLNLNKFC